MRNSLDGLHEFRGIRATDLGDFSVGIHHTIHANKELGMLHIRHLREDALCGLVGLDDNMLVEFLGVHAEGFVELRALVVVQVHGGVHGETEEFAPETGLEVVEEFWTGLQNCSEEISVSRLVLAPVLKVLEHGIELVVGVALEVAIDGDITPVANLLGEVGAINDELGLEECVAAILGKETEIQSEIEVGKGFVDEAGMASFIAREEGEDLCDDRVGVLQATSQLFVQKESGELSSARTFEELNEDLASGAGNLLGGGFKSVITDKVLLVVVTAEFGEHCFELCHVEVRVLLDAEKFFHFVEIGGIEAARSGKCSRIKG